MYGLLGLHHTSVNGSVNVNVTYERVLAPSECILVDSVSCWMLAQLDAYLVRDSTRLMCGSARSIKEEWNGAIRVARWEDAAMPACTYITPCDRCLNVVVFLPSLCRRYSDLPLQCESHVYEYESQHISLCDGCDRPRQSILIRLVAYDDSMQVTIIHVRDDVDHEVTLCHVSHLRRCLGGEHLASRLLELAYDHPEALELSAGATNATQVTSAQNVDQHTCTHTKQ